MENLKPKLRFPEFREDWKKTVFSNLIDVIDGDRGKSYPKSTEFSENGFCLFLNAKNVTKNGFNFNTLNFISEEKDKELNKGKLIKEDLVLTTRGTVGNFAYYNNEIILEHIRINSGMVILRINSTKILNSKYLYKYTSSNTLSKTIENVAFGSAQPQLTVKEIKKFPLSYPTLLEQTKIADFLGAVDKQLDILNLKKEKLNLYKKGVMQQLFSQQIRFKDDNGNDFPDWEEKTLGKIVDVRDGTHDSPKYITESPYYLITSKNLNSNGKLDFNDIKYLKKEDFTKINLRSKVEYGDILFGMIGTIGNPVIVTEDKINFAIKNMALLKKSKNINNEFLYHQFKSQIIENQFRKLNTGNTQKFLSLTTIRNLKILFPEIQEQTKIAEFLSAIDTQIQAIENQITKTETYKKGLLQQMFV